MWILTLQLAHLLKIEKFRYRNLTQGEIEMCQIVFGSLIQYQQVKIVNQPYLPWQPNNMFMAPEGYIHIRDLHFKNDYSKENINFQGIFIHEMILTSN